MAAVRQHARPGPRKPADRLAPAERLLDALSLPLAHRIADMPCGTGVDRGTSSADVLCDIALAPCWRSKWIESNTWCPPLTAAMICTLASACSLRSRASRGEMATVLGKNYYTRRSRAVFPAGHCESEVTDATVDAAGTVALGRLPGPSARMVLPKVVVVGMTHSRRIRPQRPSCPLCGEGCRRRPAPACARLPPSSNSASN
jgi:hypothetical protein